ncbi:MAG: hypothetical protein PVJ63_10760 [Thioalkalispiraceae bacterium]|jgi:hypothetical protein
MIVSSSALAFMVSIALSITIVAPVVLLILWVKDWKKGQLW